MKKITALLLILNFSSAFGRNPKPSEEYCFEGDSRNYQEKIQEYNAETLTATLAKEVVRTLATKLNCFATPIIRHSECPRPFGSSRTLSDLKVCLVETANMGYFLISVDYLGNLNITFNRWD